MTGDVRAARSALKTYITIMIPQRKVAVIQQARDYAASHLPGLLEADNGEVFRAPQEWDADYYDAIVVDLMDNFSARRFEHALNVGQTLYSQPSATNEDDRPAGSAENEQGTTEDWVADKSIPPLWILVGGAALLWALVRLGVSFFRK